MKRKILLSILLVFASTQFIAAQKKSTISSPDGRIRFSVQITAGTLLYDVVYKKATLISQSNLGLSFSNLDFFESGVKISSIKKSSGTDDYLLLLGKTSKVHEIFNEGIFNIKQATGNKQIFVHVKVYNEAIGFRYEFPKQENWDDYILTNENTGFNVAGNPIVTAGYLENYTTSHEHRYHELELKQIPDTMIDLPVLFKFPEKVYMSITEANLRNYAGMSLRKRKGILFSNLTPLPGQDAIKVKASLPHQTPWRVIMISDRPGAFIESNILTNLCEPSTVTDLSWLKPGKASFHWWNGDVMPDTTFEAGVNFNFNKYYIDFCARNNIDYHTVIGNRGVAWYQNDGNEYQPGPHTDILKPRTGLDIQQITDYAKSKGVGIRFWVHWKPLYEKLDSAFALFERWGIKGMMVDFMDRDDQEMMNIQEEILKKAAMHHLEIQFHGAFKPTGISRTYPNESTREGTLNYENDKWGNLITPNDDLNVVFTRALAGPADYHLGGFNAMPAATFKQQYTRPHVLGTRCHMLAMYVVLENHLSMLCDYPHAYEGEPGFEFLQKVPTVWDETIVPVAEPGNYVVVARRKASDWYIGAINNDKERILKLPLSFLPAGNYKLTVFSDAVDVNTNPNHLQKNEIRLKSGDEYELRLAAGGGQAIIITKEN